jgi:hypothetical protein
VESRPLQCTRQQESNGETVNRRKAQGTHTGHRARTKTPQVGAALHRCLDSNVHHRFSGSLYLRRYFVPNKTSESFAKGVITSPFWEHHFCIQVCGEWGRKVTVRLFCHESFTKDTEICRRNFVLQDVGSCFSIPFRVLFFFFFFHQPGLASCKLHPSSSVP